MQTSICHHSRFFAFWGVLNECGGLQRSCGGIVMAGSIDGGGCGGCDGFFNQE